MASEEAGKRRFPASETETAPATPVQVDTTDVVSSYSNWCRLHGTPEELVFDFGLYLNEGQAGPRQPVKISHRIVVGLYAAKRILGQLHQAIARHEQIFGPLEMDPQKRAEAAHSRS